MSGEPDNVDVLIVGGGPTGLAAANALGMRGVKCLLVEAEPGPATLPRAVSVDDEAMRFIQALGLADHIRRIAVPGTGTKYFGAAGQLLMYGRTPARPRYGYPIKNPIDHPQFQQTLAAGLDRFPNVEVRYETRLTGFVQTANAVTAKLEANRESGTVMCQYLLGADGGRSLVRRLMGQEPMAGTAFEERWLVLDTLNDPHDERYAMHHGEPSRPRVVIVGPDGRCRYEFLLHDDEHPTGAEVLQLALRLVAPYRDIEPADVARCTIYKFYALVANRFSSGRVFIAGDAAHMMPPFAGQGLNSGLRDAANLSWKLAEVLDGNAGPPLLDSYTNERRPHVDEIVRLSVRMGAVMMTESGLRARLRDVVLRAARQHPAAMGRVPLVSGFLRDLRIRPSARYDTGFVVPDAESRGLVGTMLRQPRVLTAAGEHTMLDDVLGTGYALLAVGARTDEIAPLANPLWERLRASRTHIAIGDRLPARASSWQAVCDLDGHLSEQLSHVEGRILLVRPDRFIAGIFHPSIEQEFASHVESQLGAPAATPVPVV